LVQVYAVYANAELVKHAALDQKARPGKRFALYIPTLSAAHCVLFRNLFVKGTNEGAPHPDPTK